MEQPKKEGSRFLGAPVDSRGYLKKYPLKVGNAESLKSMLEEYVFFTPAILYTHGSFSDAPLIDCVYELRENIKFYFKKFNKPLFRGLELPGDSDWNHVLWAVNREYWDYVHDFLVSVTLSFSLSKNLMRVGSQDLLILDPLAMDKQVLFSPDLPSLPITSFGINGNKFRAAFGQEGSLLMDPPTLMFYGPVEDIKVFARAYYEGKNPHNARENFINKKKHKEL